MLPSDAKALDYCDQLFTVSLWDLLVIETNRYAQQKGKPFEVTSIAEMKAFMGLTAAMSIHKLPRISNYWSSHWILGVPQFAQVHTKNRFMSLWYNIHLVDNTTGVPRDHPDHDRLQNSSNDNNDTFAESYDPSQNISINEIMIRFKGRSTMKQYLLP